MTTIKTTGKRRSSTSSSSSLSKNISKCQVAVHQSLVKPTPTSTITTDVNNQLLITHNNKPSDSNNNTALLPPVHSLLSANSSAVVDSTLFLPSSDAPHFTTLNENAFTAISTSSNSQSYFYRDFYPASSSQHHQWSNNMSSSAVSYQQVDQSSSQFLGQTVFSATDEFFLTAQQMAAHLFDQYNSNNYSGADLVPPPVVSNQHQDCSLYHHHHHQPLLNFSHDDQQTTSGALFLTNSVEVENGAGFQHHPAITAFHWQDGGATSSGDGSYISEKSSSVVPTITSANNEASDNNGYEPLSERQTVLMLPPPVNYRRRNERERERVRCVNDGYSRLREIIPSLRSRQKRISKVETLRAASRYIRSLQEALRMPHTTK